MSRTRLAAGAGAVAVFALFTAAWAWACIPSSNLWSEPNFAPPGHKVHLHGAGFAGDSVEIRWGSKDGPVLATGSAPDFSLAVTLPQVADGIYLVFAVAYEQGADGSLAARGFNQTPVEVTADNVRGSWGDGGWRQQPGKDPDRAPEESPRRPVDEPGPSPVDTSDPAPVDSSVPAPVDSPQPAASPPPAATVSSQPAAAPAPRQAAERPAHLGAEAPPGAPAPTSGPQPVPPPLAEAEGHQAAAEQAAPQPARTGAAVVSGDLWRGFRAGSSASLGTGDGAAVTATGSASHLVAGLGLLGAGLVTLAGGLAVAVAGRRRARGLASDELS